MSLKRIYLILFLIMNVYAKEYITFIEDPTPPFIIGKYNEPPKGGISVDILKEVFKNIDEYDLKLLPLTPWKKSLELVKEGKVDGIIHIIKNNDRGKYLYFSDSFLTSKTVFFYNKNNPKEIDIKTNNDLERYDICALKGVNVLYYLNNLKKTQNLDINIYKVDSQIDCIKLLNLSRIDLYPENYYVGKYYLKLNNISDNFEVYKTPIYDTTYHFAFSKNTKAHEILPKINQIIKKLKENGTTEKIKKRYTDAKSK